jgi:hypothetical protein
MGPFSKIPAKRHHFLFRWPLAQTRISPETFEGYVGDIFNGRHKGGFSKMGKPQSRYETTYDQGEVFKICKAADLLEKECEKGILCQKPLIKSKKACDREEKELQKEFPYLCLLTPDELKLAKSLLGKLKKAALKKAECSCDE